MTFADMQQNPIDALAARWDRALAIKDAIYSNPDKFTCFGGKLYVESSDGATAYTVTAQSCDCFDSVSGFAATYLSGVCKHRMLMHQLTKLRNGEPLSVPPAVVARPVPGIFKAERPRRPPTRSAAELLASLPN